MFGYGRSNFTWNGTLRELEGKYSCAERRRWPTMTASPSSSTGLEVLLSTLQNAGDVESTLNILNVLDELLSAGTDRRIHYMISKGGSEALLTALVNTGRTFSPNYTILLPLLHLLAKVGHRDRRIGMKGEDAKAVLLTLNLLKQNINHARRATACLLVIQVFSTSVSAANLIGANQGLDVIYRLIPQYTTKYLHTAKASINAFAALLCTKANVHLAVSKGYVAGLLRLYEEWHKRDTQHAAIEIRHALLHCLHKATYGSAGRRAFLSQGGIRLLYQSTQACLLSKCLEPLVEPSVQLMRKCLPKTPLPLTSDQSAYSFPLPGRPHAFCDADVPPEMCAEWSDEEEEDDDEQQEPESKDYDDDLETDLTKLRHRPDPDRPKEELLQYSRLCPELSDDFQGLGLSSGTDESSTTASSSSDEDAGPLRTPPPRSTRRISVSSGSSSETDSDATTAHHRPKPDAQQLRAQDFHSDSRILSTSPACGSASAAEPRRGATAGQTREPPEDERAGEGEKAAMVEEEEEEVVVVEEGDEQGQGEGEGSGDCSMIERLLERHGACVPHHDPAVYRSVAAKTRSIPGFDILAFPDFWGHLPPPGHETMAPRKPNVQRQKVFEDVQRFLDADDIINQVVFDLEDSSFQSPADRPDSLRFFSKFECGNLRKAVQVRRYEYDLILNADANCSQHTQWFYFEVSNMETNVPYRFNVINCEKGNSQFNYGMQPVLYSVREALEGRPHWIRAGTEICYFRNHFCPARGQRKTTFYTLTFTITFKHNEDVCYLAYHYPYTYSAIKAHLNVLQKSVDPTKVYFRQQILCPTLAGNSCPIVTITACPPTTSWRDIHQLRKRPCVVLTGRVHPGESNASWVMKGSLEFLCSSDPMAQSLREAFVFKIVPIINPDGVINGLNRCDLNAEDLNRQWHRPDPALSPTIFHTKGLLHYLNTIGKTPLVYCDYHGHSRKKNVFLYGCSVKETLWQSGSPIDTVGLKEDPGYRTLAKTLDRIAPAFSFNSCNYLVEKSRSATARVVVWREMGVLRSYTMESTYNGCDQGIYKGLQTGTRELQEMGAKFCQSLLSVVKDVSTLRNKKILNYINVENGIRDHKSHNCFEDDEPPCVESIEYSTDFAALGDPDSDVDRNMAIGDKEGDSDGEDKQWQGAKKAHRFPQLIQQTSMEALSEKRNARNGVSITNGQIMT